MAGDESKVKWGGTAARALLLACACAAAGLAFNLGRVVKYFRGEYRTAFAAPSVAGDPPLIGLPEAADLFASGQAVFIDARSPEEYEEGHVAGAKSVPLYDPASDLIWESMGLPREAMIVVYCSGDLCQDSLILARRVSRLGWRNVKVFPGGWVEWEAAELPAERGR